MGIKKTRIYVLYAFIFLTALFSSMTSHGHGKVKNNDQKEAKKVHFNDQVAVREFGLLDKPADIRSNGSNQSSIDYRIPIIAAGLLITIPTTIWFIKKYKKKRIMN